MRKRLTSVTVLVGIGIWAASLGLYLSTLAPTLTWGYKGIGVDGGELLTAASTLGIPHPPGYPTYTLLLKLFATLVPVGDFAFRGNLFSALLASVSVVLLYSVIVRFCRYLRPKGPRPFWIASAALGSTVFATAPLFWSQSVITEVYTLNALFVGALVLLASRLALGQVRHTPSTNTEMALFGLVLGFGLGNHITLVAVALPLIYWLVTALGWRTLISPLNIGAFFLGLGVYVYLPVRAAQSPPVNWGNADTLGGLVWMLSGRVYQGYVFGVPVDSILERVVSWLELVFSQFNPLGIFMGVIGSVSLRSREPRFLIASLASIVILLVYSVTYGTFDAEVLTIPALYIFSVLVGIGALQILASVSSWARSTLTGSGNTGMWRFRITESRLMALAVVVGLLALPITSVILNYSSQNLRGDRVAYQHAREILDSVPDGSVVLSTEENNVFSLWYMRYVEQTGRDVAPVAVPLLQFDWYWRDIHDRYPKRIPSELPKDVYQILERIVRHNDGDADVYFTYWNSFLEDNFDLERVGDIYKANLKPAP